MIFADIPFYIHLLNFLIIAIGAFMIIVVLIQRGKGGGLAGAFGGAGGSSPFGSRAGDAFTRFTLIVALIWAVSIMIEVRLVQWHGEKQAKTSIVTQK